MDYMIDYNIDEFKDYLIKLERSAATIEKYVRDITGFFRWLSGDEASKEKVIEYKNNILQQYAISSVNSMLSAINTYFDFCNQPQMKVKTIKLQRRVFLNENKELTKQEYEKLINTAKNVGNYRLCLVMQTICSLGLRVSELQHITVSAVENGCANINCKGKLRTIILPHHICKVLTNYIKKNKIRAGSVFVTRSGKPLDRSNIWSDMKALCKKAGISEEKVFPHNLRHLFARTYYKIQKDIVRLADVLGHSNINTTRIYTMESGALHRKSIQRLGLLIC